MADTALRLPRTLVPSAYRIRLDLDLDEWTFTGACEIDALVPDPTERLCLHAVDLDVRRATVTHGATEHAATTSVDGDGERLDLRLDTKVQGAATVRVEYAGAIGERLAGLYRSTFEGADGAQHRIAATQLFATDARRVFPCVDEPAAKATFELTAVVPGGVLALSNSPVAEERALAGGRRELRFKPTIPMSTYLVALVVGDLEQSESVDVDGVALSVVHPPGSAHLAGLAMRSGAFALRFFRDYFGIDYPGDKLDLVAIPDFAYGAMENLGCIVFRDRALLVDERAATPAELQVVATIVSHEIAHMWFGDLVTMAWWEGLWLNEAFATFMSQLCVDAFRPDFHVWLRTRDELEAGLEIDELHSTRAIESEVKTPAEAFEMADLITYVKGSGVLRMLEQYLGATTFRDGVRRYLLAHSYANTKTSDLWDALEEASGEPVAAVMASWVLQGGHPVVWLRRGELSQAPFCLGPSRGNSNIATHWKVPIRLRALGDGTERTLVLDAPAKVDADGAVVANTGAGAYRTGYDAERLAALRRSFGELTELERAVLLADTYALARAGNASLADVLGLVSQLGDAVEPAAWWTVQRILATLDRVCDDALRPALQSRAVALATPLYRRLGFDAAQGEDTRAALVRPVALRLMGGLGTDEAVRAEAIGRFEQGRDQGPVADAIGQIVSACARPRDRDELLTRMAAATDPQLAQRCRNALAGFQDTPAALELLDRATTLFRSQDLPFVLHGLVENRVAGPAVWEALTERWESVMSQVPAQLHRVVLMAVAELYTDERTATSAAAFVRSHPPAVGRRQADQALELLDLGVAFRARALPELRSLLVG